MINCIYHFLTKNKSAVVIITLVGVLSGLYSFLPKKDQSVGNTYIVSSQHQSGGITGGQVNVTETKYSRPVVSANIIQKSTLEASNLYSTNFQLGISLTPGEPQPTSDNIRFVPPLTNCTFTFNGVGNYYEPNIEGLNTTTFMVQCASKKPIESPEKLFYICISTTTNELITCG